MARKHPNQTIEWSTGHGWEKMNCAEEIWELLDRMPWMEIHLRVSPKEWIKYNEVKK